MLDTIDAALSRINDESELIELAPGETSLDFLQRVYRSVQPKDACGDLGIAPRASPTWSDCHRKHEWPGLCVDA
jgi:hypothetical protein